MLKKLVSNHVDNITDDEFKLALKWTTIDIKANNLYFSKLTFVNYIIPIIVKSLFIVRKYDLTKRRLEECTESTK